MTLKRPAENETPEKRVTKYRKHVRVGASPCTTLWRKPQGVASVIGCNRRTQRRGGLRRLGHIWACARTKARTEHAQSHMTWNDQEKAVRACGLGSWIHLMVVIFNLCHGPFNSDARWAQLKEIGEEYLEHMAMECPMLEADLLELAKDYEVEHAGSDAELKLEVISAMREDWHLQNKGTVVKLCRFANWVDRAAEFDRGYTFAKLRVMYYGLQTDLLSRGPSMQCWPRSESQSRAQRHPPAPTCRVATSPSRSSGRRTRGTSTWQRLCSPTRLVA